MTQAPACYQDGNDVLNLSYAINTAEDIVLAQAPAPMTAAPMTLTPGGHTRGNTPFPPGYEILFSNSRRGSNLTRHLLLYRKTTSNGKLFTGH
jgi:hypothetical protein